MEKLVGSRVGRAGTVVHCACRRPPLICRGPRTVLRCESEHRVRIPKPLTYAAHSTPNPLRVVPPASVKIITHDKFTGKEPAQPCGASKPEEAHDADADVGSDERSSLQADKKEGRARKGRAPTTLEGVHRADGVYATSADVVLVPEARNPTLRLIRGLVRRLSRATTHSI